MNAIVNEMRKKIRVLEDKVMTNDNILRQDKLEIAGVPTTVSQNPEEIAFEISKKVYPGLQKDDVIKAFRIGKPKDHQGNNNPNRAILVQYKSPGIRNAVFTNKKVLKDVNLASLNIGNENRRLYINENLASDVKFLLHRVNVLRKEKQWKFLWTKAWMIYTRKDENARAILVKCEEDLKLIV